MRTVPYARRGATGCPPERKSSRVGCSQEEGVADPRILYPGLSEPADHLAVPATPPGGSLWLLLRPNLANCLHGATPLSVQVW